MLGRWILDPEHVECDREKSAGQGLLPVVTRFGLRKHTRHVSGAVVSGDGLLRGSVAVGFQGYEIHMGTTTVDSGDPHVQPFQLSRRPSSPGCTGDGMISADGWTMGTYIHGLFDNETLRGNKVGRIAARRGVGLPPERHAFSQSAEYDKLAGLVRRNLDMEAVYRVAGLSQG